MTMPQKPAMTYRDLVREWQHLAATYATAYQATRRSLYSRLAAAYSYCAGELERVIAAEDPACVDGVEEDDRSADLSASLDAYFQEFVEP